MTTKVICMEILISSPKKQRMTYLSLHMEHVRNTGNVLYCVTFEQQEMHDDIKIMCLSLVYSYMTQELMILSN